MSKAIHFFDLDDTLWKVHSKAWIVLKQDTSKPIYVLSTTELNDILLGLNKHDEIDLDYNGSKYWISELIFDKIKKKKKNITKDMLGVSFTELINPDYFKKITIYIDNIKHLSNTSDDIGILSARHSEKNDNILLKSLNDELRKHNIEIKKFYYLYDHYVNIVNNYVNFKKMNVLLEHMVGFKIKDDRFVALKQDLYDEVFFYDDEFTNINVCESIQTYFNAYIKNTEDEVYDKIIKLIETNQIKLTTNLISDNRLNRFKTSTITLKKPTSFPIREGYNIMKFAEFKIKN